MANRSYLYNLDFNRIERAKTKEDKILGVSEFTYEIPLSYKILLSSNPINTYSMLWDYEHPILIAGDAKEGKQKLFKFLDEIDKNKIYEQPFIQEQINKTKLFFKENIFNLKYFFMEGGESYQMNDTPLEEQNKVIYNQIMSIDETIDSFYYQVHSINKKIASLEHEMKEMTKGSWFRESKYVLSDDEINKIQEIIKNKIMTKRGLLGIDNWSKILYFHFGE